MQTKIIQNENILFPYPVKLFYVASISPCKFQVGEKLATVKVKNLKPILDFDSKRSKMTILTSETRIK